MLFEKIDYSGDFPIHITICNLKNYPIHYHQDTEFVMVLKGEITLKNGYCEYSLKEGDIFTNSAHEVHSLSSKGSDNMVALIHISTHYFSQYIPTLSKACYRTYSNKGSNKKYDTLREKLMQILLQYMIKSFNYKSSCIYMMVDVIKYLDKYFNLFAFEENMVINFDSGNQITIDRISRIIGYIYEFHADKITLDDLAAMEHLSTFYLSHIIKECTGMNFREFLCFARVEWSQIDLLETSKKMSQVARDVGFSTTSYYEKYFEKWFGMNPESYRNENLPKVLSDINRPTLLSLSNSEIVSVLKHGLSALDSSQPASSTVTSLKLELAVDQTASSIFRIRHSIDLCVTPEDYRALGLSIISYISPLNPGCITILTNEDDEPNELNELQHSLSKVCSNIVRMPADDTQVIMTYGFDSIAYPLYMLSHYLKSKDSVIRVRLRDPSRGDSIVNGYPALITSGGVRKPVYYIVQALSLIRGEVIYWGKQYTIIRNFSDNGHPYFIIVAYNYNDQIYNLCTKKSTAFGVKEVLDDFKDEVDLSINMTLNQGMYTILKYSLTKERGIFSDLALLGFSNKFFQTAIKPGMIATEPYLDIYTEDVRATFNINFNFKGVGIQFAVITPRD